MTVNEFKRLTERMTKALTAGVKKAIREHLREGNPVYVMRGEKIVAIQPKKRRR